MSAFLRRDPRTSSSHRFHLQQQVAIFSRKCFIYVIILSAADTEQTGDYFIDRYTCGFIVPKKIQVRACLSLNTQASHSEAMNERVVGANKILVLW